MRSRRLRLLAILFVAGAMYGKESLINTPPPGPAGAGVSSVTAVPLGDGVLAIWVEGSYCGPQELRGIRLDADGNPRDASSFAMAPGRTRTAVVAVASVGDTAYVAWRSSEQSGNACHLTRIGADATVTTLSDTLPVLGASAMLAGQDNLLFLDPPQSPNGPLNATLVDLAGTVLQSAAQVADPGPRVSGSDAVAAGGAYLIGWIASDGRVHVTSVPAAAVATNSVPIVPYAGGAAGSAEFLRLASDGINVMAFWYESSAHELRARSLSTLGTPLNAAPVSIGAFRPVEPPSVVVTSSGYQLFFREQTISSQGEFSQVVSLDVSFDGTLRSVSRGMPSSLDSVSAARNGGRIVALWNELRYTLTNASAGWQAVAAPLVANGTLGVSAIISLDVPPQQMLKLLPYAGGAVALWAESAPNDRLVVGRLTAAGQPLDGAGLRLHESMDDQAYSAIATDGQSFLAVWTEGQRSFGRPLYAALMSPNAQFLSAKLTQLANDAGGYSDIAVAWNGESYTIVYQRSKDGVADFAALRLDRAGNVLDPTPIVVRTADPNDANPRLSWSGSEYLLVWQRFYGSSAYLPEPVPCMTPGPPTAELFAQRISASLAPEGAQIDLATAPNQSIVTADAQHTNVAFTGDRSLVEWIDELAGGAVYARIDTGGNRLDSLYGRYALFSCDQAFLAATSDGWMIASEDWCGQSGTGVRLARIGPDGVATTPVTAPLSSIDGLEAFALTPLPLVAYKRVTSTGVYVDTLPIHGRVVGH